MLLAIVLSGVAFACPQYRGCSVRYSEMKPVADLRQEPGVDMGFTFGGMGTGLNFRFAFTEQWALETDLSGGVWEGPYGTNWSYGGRAGLSVVPGRWESDRSSFGPRFAAGAWTMVNNGSGEQVRQDLFGPYAQAGFEWAPATRNNRLTVIGGMESNGRISDQGYLYLERPRPHFGMRWRLGG